MMREIRILLNIYNVIKLLFLPSELASAALPLLF